MPVSVRSLHLEPSSRYGGSSYSPSSYTPTYRSLLPTYRSTTYTSSFRSTSGLDDSYTSSREKSDSGESSYSSTSKSREYSKSRSLSNAESALKSSSLSSSSLPSSGVSSRRPSAASSSYTSSVSSVLDISRYSPANYVAGSSRSAAAATSSRPPRASFSSLRDTSYVPSISLRSSRYTEPETDRESSSPVKAKSSQDLKGLTGLNNIGNTCFLNSIVQCLSNTKVLLEYIINDEYLSEIRSSAKSALVKRFAELIKNLWQGEKTSIPTYSFKTEVDVYAPRFSGFLQQDAQEFLRYLLEGLHDELNRVTTNPKRTGMEIDDDLSDSQKASESWKRYLRFDNSKIVDTFGGLLKSSLECTHCGHCSTTFEPFWDLSLPIPDSISHPGKLVLSHCLDLFTKEEFLDGDEMPTCSKCKTRRKCKKRILIYKFPEVLVIHLKRFSLGSRARKVDSAIDFPVSSLDMGAYSAVTGGELKSISYDLYAVVNHNGTCHTGHYTAYCRHPYSAEWHLFNDRSVTPLCPETMSKRDGYVLFYEQTSSTNL